ncbi:MAG TPA: Na+/H+ antiporter NhaA [Nitrospiria bacterium]|nr:Na+/H+ antiporter NhaA [Nitrospiria bacterium]
MLQHFLVHPFQDFFRTEAIGGILLLAATVIAMIAANTGLAPVYHRFWETPFRLGVGEFSMKFALHHWINDGLMAVFFFVVGLEIKREVTAGELSAPKKALLPIAAAAGGMLIPASLYAVINMGGKGLHGWGIPMATDIAFALGVLALLGKRAPTGLLVFLTALAIVDDLGAVLAIAFFYGGRIAPAPLLLSGAVVIILFVLNIAGVRRIATYMVLGVVLWMAFLKSGIHATVAGVLLAFTVPIGAEPMESPLHQLERTLHPWVTFAIMPLFAFANAGVDISWQSFGEAIIHPVTLGVVVGLVLGKQLGVMLCSWLPVRLGWAELPSGVTWRHLSGVSWLAGIGFTMSIFIANLAFEDPHLVDLAKIGILLASLIAGAVGYGVLAGGAEETPPGGTSRSGGGRSSSHR